MDKHKYEPPPKQPQKLHNEHMIVAPAWAPLGLVSSLLSVI